MSVGGFDANDLTGVAQITAVSAGSDGWQHNSSAAALAGAGVGGVFAGGTGTSGLAADLVIQVGGNSGSQLLSFGSGTTAAQMVTALNLVSDSTGVTASVEGDELQFKSAEYGKASFVSVKVVSEGTGGTFGSSLSATYAMGTDIAATVNNIAATGSGNTISFSSSSLSFSASLDPAQIAVGDEVKFNLNGGGALFQLGPQVASSQQARLGIQSVDTGTLGGTVGRLYQLASGKDASLATSTQLAGKIILAAIDGVSSLRGQLGAFQKSTVDTNIASLTDAVTNLTAAQSSIQDADFATESANLTRAQILVQSGTAVLGIANKNPENVLALLR
jgi:flagellin